ncbi:uncharacterized protein AB675_7691 [Cyphellophora attinorum]|uniref:FAD dependent oxidoreductase domain-containing protein n=1 Tax=Cyphellophora attinorum TaxID=1664694 RepID=A0A0N1HR24_9EURO|nr:uncharacterized protein AB675_7691 [Phialophora attinorum]KPI40585.1 hypothetical protein AB675_7691 [Phialophora attinorum]
MGLHHNRLRHLRAAIAYKLLTHSPHLKILMLEARTAASGASGRNGGHCRAGWWLNFEKYAAAWGEEEAVKFEELERGNVEDVAGFVREEGVDCDFREVVTVDAFYTEGEWGRVKRDMGLRKEVRRRLGVEEKVEQKVWEGREAEEQTGLKGVIGAVGYKAYTQNPYRGKVEVHTFRGNVRAANVVLATNAYTNSLHDGLAKTGFLKPSRSQVTAIRPAEGNVLQHASIGKSIALDDKGSGDYFFIRQPGLEGAGDVLYGGGRSISPTREMGITDDSTINEAIAVYQKRSVPEAFGQDQWGKQSDEIRDWTGITCYTPDTYPLVGQLPGEQGLWASVGMDGHGMAMAFRSAEALVQLMTMGEEPEWLPKGFRMARAWEETRVNFSPHIWKPEQREGLAQL